MDELSPASPSELTGGQPQPPADPDQIQQAIEAFRRDFERDAGSAATREALEQVRVKYLGRKSPLSGYLHQLGALPPERRGEIGKLLNVTKAALESRLAAAQQTVSVSSAPPVDVTLPGLRAPLGVLHPISAMIAAILERFTPMGFEVAEGPEVELEWNNFDALNIPAEHPSRESFDTFFVDARSPQPDKGRLVLRSHTSPVQIRVMQSRRPPLRIVVPGRVYRPDPLDASHSFMFHQIEGLLVDERASFADLQGTLTHFLKSLFGPSTTMRFRPHFFPFTEPSAEVDIACASCSGEGCQTCGRKGWLEVMGCGMVHPNVFKAVGYDPARVQGFAFGMGVERLAMLKHGVRDIRLFFDNDLRFLEQFE